MEVQEDTMVLQEEVLCWMWHANPHWKRTMENPNEPLGICRYHL